MIWKRFLGVFIALSLIIITTVVNPTNALILACYKIGLNSWGIFLCVSAWTSLTMVLTYYEFGQIKKWRIVNLLFKKLRNFFPQNSFKLINRIGQKKFVSYLSRQKSWVILTLGFAPFVPYLPTTVIITTKLLDISYGILFLLLGNACRNWFYCERAYQLLVGQFS